MKTPLQVIGGYAELIANSMVSQEDVPRFAGLIRGEAENMRNLIDDVLVLSRLDENATGELQPVCLADICHIVVARLNTEAADKQIDIHMHLDEKLHVNADPTLCEQMIYNLVNNAIKYNDDGGAVLIKVCKDAEDALVIVADSGRGIEPELRERVFERFFRADSSRSREDGSTGLGLAIVKHAAELFGGSVIATDSDLGGAQFEVRIPMVV